VSEERTLGAVVAGTRRGRTALRERVTALESKMETVDGDLRAFVPEDGRWERVRERAGELEAAYPDPPRRPPLYGVPVGVKDIFHVDGLETRAGSDLPPDVLTGTQGTAVDWLQEAGAIVLGKTVTAEFAHVVPGPTRNPHDPAHTPGGSSSGSAAAVAAGLCPLALGTQTIGSVIRPAAFCGVVGVKPTFGRIPTDGVIPASPSVDHVGYFTQDVAGARLAAAVLCSDWRTLPEPREKPTLGVPEGAYLAQASEAGLAAFEESVEDLSAAGYDIERVDLFEDIERINDRHETLASAETAITHAEWYEEHADRYAEGTREIVEQGKEVSAAAIARGLQGRNDLRERIEAAMDETGIDVWVAPAAPGPAPEGLDDTGDPVMNLPWTHSGLPTVSLPAGTVDGLPVGVQCATRFGADEDLLGWAEGLSAALRADG
jgi:Asp-tRNA(Asn)/Glu-tRNA(Gln) amidotransferase A subunit family amidase